MPPTIETGLAAVERDTDAGELSDAELRTLTAGLVYCTKRLGRIQEEATIQRLLIEVSRCWPGEFADWWWKWLLEAGRSLNLELRVVEVDERDLGPLAESGVVAVTLDQPGRSLTGLEFTRRQGVIERRLGDDEGGTAPTRSAGGPPGPRKRIVIGDLHAKSADSGGHAHPKPFQLLMRLLAPETKDMIAIAAISAVAGLLMLSVPVTAQQLVRAVTFASLYQPILVLSLILLGLLGFVAALQFLQFYVAEIIQQRLFVRVAGAVARHLPRTSPDVWRQRDVPELMNRFMDVVIVQKVVAALLVDGVAIVLTTVIGMSVMAFYHPFLLGYDVLLLVLLCVIVFGFGRTGVKTAVQESMAKYRTIAWLENVARCPSIFQAFGVDTLAAERADSLCAQYLRERSAHFRILIRQIVLILLVQALATTTLLGLGGYLVLQEQLTLGQLVAAELIVAAIVGSFMKLGKHIEGWYDLLAAVDKLGHLTELPLESRAGLVGLPRRGAAVLEFRLRGVDAHGADVNNVSPAAGTRSGAWCRLTLMPGESLVLWHWDESALASMRRALQGFRSDEEWMISVDGVDLADIRSDVIRAHIAVVCEQEFLPGTIAENVHLHRAGVSDADVFRALDVVGLTEEFRYQHRAVSDAMQPSGWPLTASQCRRLVIARGLVGRPRALVIDHLLDSLSDEELKLVASRLQEHLTTLTLVVFTAQVRVAQLFPRVVHPQVEHVLPRGAASAHDEADLAAGVPEGD